MLQPFQIKSPVLFSHCSPQNATDVYKRQILGSVVPVLSGRVLSALRILCNARILTVGPGLKSGIKLRLDNPAQLGAELLCGAVAALAE